MADTATSYPTVDVRCLRLDVELQPDGGATVVSIRGEIDAYSSPLLHSILAAVIDHGATRLVIDASGVGFIDCAGLRPVRAAAVQLGRHDTKLIIRSPSEPMTRLLELTGLTKLVGIEPADSGERNGHDQQALAHALGQVAAIPAGRDVIDATLTAVVVLAAATIAAADGASLTMLRHGQLITAAATDDTIVNLDHLQYDSGQGPCVDAATHGRPFHLDLVEDDQRYPAFTPHVIKQGFRSILSTPVLTSTGSVGALNLYARSIRSFDNDEQALALVFADQASTVVSHARTVTGATHA